MTLIRFKPGVRIRRVLSLKKRAAVTKKPEAANAKTVRAVWDHYDRLGPVTFGFAKGAVINT